LRRRFQWQAQQHRVPITQSRHPWNWRVFEGNPDVPKTHKPPDSADPRASSWKSRPLFISSTFADMHDERDYLRVHAFAELAERLRERRHYLETIDLRHGVETSSEEDLARREMKVLKVCLDEIKRSRPFFVGIIGDRYGTAMPLERLETAAGDAGLGADVAGCSVTELEILYGVLESTGQRSRLRRTREHRPAQPELVLHQGARLRLHAG
jgi:hypothetical protein